MFVRSNYEEKLVALSDISSNIKSQKYSKFRFDIFFSKKKYNNLNIIENGGWHFSNLKNEV